VTGPERELVRLVTEAVAGAAADLGVDGTPEAVEIDRPRAKEHGDYATNVALALARPARRSPRDVADAIVRHLPASDLVAKVEIAGPGFINFFVTHDWLYDVLREIRASGERYGRQSADHPERVLVEFVSTNPTGPLHVGHARGAAMGDGLCRVLEAAGHLVEREYYVNDAGTQALLFGASVEARYLERFGQRAEIPEGGYQGEYVKDLAARIADEHGEAPMQMPSDERRAFMAREGMRLALEGIRATLERFDVRFDAWIHESTFHDQGKVNQALEELRSRGLAYEEDGALWFRATRYGDEKDRVLIRATGDPTYFAADCAYVLDKFGRGYDRLIYVWGADHHGTVKRLHGAVEAFGFDRERVEFILTQLVALYRGGEPVRMSKRTGDLVTVDELLDEVGADAARYTLLSRSPNTPLDFDIELVTRQSLDNPVYYVQYAHARIASLLRYAREQGRTVGPLDQVRVQLLEHETELALLSVLADFPELVRGAAELRAPYRLTKYAEETAAAFHRFYSECRIVTEDRELTEARLQLAEATRQVIANTLALLGVSAPVSMERLDEEGG
jgi:arginyl-tRNA synthetase